MQLPLYQCNSQVHRTTNSSPYILVLSKQLPGQSIAGATTDMKPSATDINSAQSMRKHLQNRFAALPLNLNTNFRKSQSRYKHDYDQRNRKIRSIIPGAKLFLESSSLQTVHDVFAAAMQKNTYNKIQACTSGPYRTINVQKMRLQSTTNAVCKHYQSAASSICLRRLDTNFNGGKIVQSQTYRRLAIRRIFERRSNS